MHLMCSYWFVSILSSSPSSLTVVEAKKDSDDERAKQIRTGERARSEDHEEDWGFGDFSVGGGGCRITVGSRGENLGFSVVMKDHEGMETGSWTTQGASRRLS